MARKTAPEPQTTATSALQVISDPALEQSVALWLNDNLFNPGRDYRKEAGDDGWNTWRDLWKGKHKKANEFDPDADSYSANICLATLDTVKGIALQTPSVVEFAPAEPDDELFAAELNAVIGEYLWSVRKARFKLGVGFLEGGIIGTAWSKTFWNPSLSDGQGDPDFMIVPAEEVYVDPSCTGINDWQYIIHAPRRPVLEVKYNTAVYNDRRLEVISDEATNAGAKKDGADKVMELVTVKEYWVKGTYLEALIGEVEGVESYVDADGRKYGMQIIVAGNLVLKIEPHPSRCDRLPFQRFVYYQPTGLQRIYGTGELEPLADTQYAVDARVTQMLAHAGLIANNQWLVSAMASANDDEFTNEPGAIIHVEGPPDAVRRIEPTGISGSLFGITNLLLELRQNISGMFDVNMGQTPGSLRAGVAIQSLQRGGEGRTAQKMANFDDWVADIGMGLADVMAAMYTEERVFRITGAVAQDLALMQQQREAAAKQQTLGGRIKGAAQALMGKSPEPAPAPEAPVGSVPVKISNKSFERDGKRIGLDARASVTMLIRDQMEKLRFDLELLAAGAVDAQYVIENNPCIRNRERLLARLAATQQQNALPPAPEEVTEEELATGTDSAISDEDAEQMSLAIEEALAQIEQLEQQGVVPKGFTAEAEALITQEMQQGGTGEMALAQVMEAVQAAVQEMQGGRMTDPSVAAGPPIV